MVGTEYAIIHVWSIRSSDVDSSRRSNEIEVFSQRWDRARRLKGENSQAWRSDGICFRSQSEMTLRTAWTVNLYS